MKTSHCGELTRFKKRDSTIDLCFLIHVPLILHHHSSEHFSCTYDTTFQCWPPRNPWQQSKPSGLKKSDYYSFKPYSSPSSNSKYDFCMHEFNLFQNILVGRLVENWQFQITIQFWIRVQYLFLTLLSCQESNRWADITSLPWNCHKGEDHRIFFTETCTCDSATPLKLVLHLKVSNKFLSTKQFGDC